VDTRNKILSLNDALGRRWPALVVAAGGFDVLRAAHARDLRALRERTGAGTLLAVVLPVESEILPRRARAEMAAALRVIDYVVIADHAELDRLVACLKPLEAVRMEAAEARRARQLIEHVHARHSL
jgi:glycerol-3-phosphate cytidylyltransferase-like family protein